MLPDLCFVTDIENNRCLSDDSPDRPTISVEIKVTVVHIIIFI